MSVDKGLEAQPIPAQEKIYLASQWQLIWWKFRKHKLALVSCVLLIALYVLALFCEFFSPYNPNRNNVKYQRCPPQALHFVDEDGFRWRPFVYGMNVSRDPRTLEKLYVVDEERKYPIYFFVHGDPYKLWGLFRADLHLIGIQADREDKDATMFLMGSDALGRDMLSRTFTGGRISLTIGLVGIAVSLTLGVLLGGISGYYGGVIDTVVQRIIEFLRSVPRLPLWMGLSAAVPPEWSPIKVYFSISVILSLIGWTGLARVVRGRFLALREEDFVMAAKLVGSSELRIIVRHMVPSFLSHLIASLTLSVPRMILSETSLSFLGIGIRPPSISWGVLLNEAQSLYAITHTPWFSFPGLFIIVAVLSFNFLGDGLRDAADPYR
jgi:peptide/nickel transport system permease protein